MRGQKTGGPQVILAGMDVKDAFWQVDQEAPTHVTTATGLFNVLENLPEQRGGAKAWVYHLTRWMSERGSNFVQRIDALDVHHLYAC